jgi:branched-chain amino acid transport system ATP-binding protein
MLSASGISKSFGGLQAVTDVSFDIAPGDVLGVIGPNGAGKTTLINIVAGVYPPDAGAVRLDGRDVTGAPAHVMAQLGVGRTFQNVRLFRTMTVFDNVLVAREKFGLGGLQQAVPWLGRRTQQRSRQAVSESLEFVGLAPRADLLAGQLPFGDQRRLEIARALALSPRYLLLDEPAAGMNEDETAALADDIQRVVARGAAILLIEHDISLIRRVSSRVMALNFGRTLVAGRADEVLAHSAVVEAYLGT